MTGPSAHGQEPIERWLADRHRDLHAGLGRFLDPDDGLREAMVQAEHADLLGALGSRLDTEAGLAAILPPLATAAPQPPPGLLQSESGTGEMDPELQQMEQMRQRRRARRLDDDVRQILDSGEGAAALADKSRRSSAAEAGLINALLAAADDTVIDAQIVTVEALLARAVMLGGDREQAEQAVAETCLEMFKEESERIRAPWGWAVQVMTRQLAVIVERDIYRRTGERQHRLKVPVPPGMPPDEQAEVALVMRALYDLSPREREVVVLYYPCGQTEEQIAEILGIGQDRAGKYLRAAIRKLQRKLRVTAPPARPGGRLTPRPAPAGITAAMAGQVGARLLAVTVWLAEGNRTDEHARQRIRQRIDARLPDPWNDEPQ